MSHGRRVLQVVGSLNVGGAETMIVTATQELVRMGISVDFLVFGEQVGTMESHVTSLGSRVLRTAAPATNGRIRFIGAMAELLRSEGPFDAVHSHVNLASGLVLAGAARAGVPIRVAHSHSANDLRRDPWTRLYTAGSRRLIFRHATHLAACGDDAGAYLFGTRWGGRGVLIPNGVDLEPLLVARHDRLDVRRELGLSSDAVVIGSVGRLVTSKNHDFLIALMGEARLEDVHLLIVGEGPRRQELEARVLAAGLADRVTFLGLRRDVPRILGALDHVVMPSVFEGLPLALVESQAAGIPALVSSSITTEVDLGLGLLRFLSIDDPDAWIDALQEPQRPAPDEADIRERLRSIGYDSVSTARRLAQLYRVG